MSATELMRPFLDGGIRSTNFFNGRLLSGEDLTVEQEANRAGLALLGQAIGQGVADGLTVALASGTGSAARPTSSITRPVVTVEPGLAINRRGQEIRLDRRVDVTLVQQTAPSPTPTGATPAAFRECEPPHAGAYVAGADAYLLTIAPVTGTDGRAPVRGLGNGAAACASRYVVQGVQFRLIPLGLGPDILADRPRLRNRVAYRCFGVDQPGSDAWDHDPLGPATRGEASYGLLDALRPNRLTDWDVPLATIGWAPADGITFVDIWSARRQITRRTSVGRWGTLLGERRRSEIEAMIEQFADQIDDLRASVTDAAQVQAGDHFEYLPPVGILPSASTGTPPAGASVGFDPRRFFGETGPRPAREVRSTEGSLATTDASLLRSLFQTALDHEPIRVSPSTPIRLYLVSENDRAVRRREAGQLGVVFSAATLPYVGVARFGAARVGISRFAPLV